MTVVKDLVRPGQGLDIPKITLAPIRADIKNGAFVVHEESQSYITYALSKADAPKAEIKAILDLEQNKSFRNAYASIILEPIWPIFNNLVAGPDGANYTISHDGAQSSLHRVNEGQTNNMSSSEIAELIATSNQDVPTHLICEALQDGNVPTITGNPHVDLYYYKAFCEQTDLVIRGGDFFPTIPKDYNSQTRFIASGLLVLRTHVFGLPNLITEVSEREGIELTPQQHRNSVIATLHTSVAHYFQPTGPINIAINSQLINPKTRNLKPESWKSNSNPDEFILFPLPSIVQGVNNALANHKLPVQTACPAFHSKVEPMINSGNTISLPRALSDMMLAQLDQRYYPILVNERDAKPSRTLFLSAGFPLATKSGNASNHEFHGGADFQLSEREQLIFDGLGSSESHQAFGLFMSAAGLAIVNDEMGSEITLTETHLKLKRFYKRILARSDAIFDSHRGEFSASMSSPQDFLKALLSIPIKVSDNLSCTAGEALNIFNKLIQDPKLYPPSATALLQEDFATFIEVAVKQQSRNDSANLGSAQTQNIKEITNAQHAAILFDILLGGHIENEGYEAARNKFIATKLAFQYQDEVLDVEKDVSEGSANLLTALAIECGEIDGLIVLLPELTGLVPELDALFKDPNLGVNYFSRLQKVTPKSYAYIMRRQHQLIEFAELPTEIATKIILPDTLYT